MTDLFQTSRLAMTAGPFPRCAGPACPTKADEAAEFAEAVKSPVERYLTPSYQGNWLLSRAEILEAFGIGNAEAVDRIDRNDDGMISQAEVAADLAGDRARAPVDFAKLGESEKLLWALRRAVVACDALWAGDGGATGA